MQALVMLGIMAALGLFLAVRDHVRKRRSSGPVGRNPHLRRRR